MLATSAHVARAIEIGASFIVLGGNPGSGTRIADVLATTKRIKDEFGDQVFLWAGADIHCIGDGGFAGCSSPENVQQLSFSIKGKPYTYYRMASVNR